jgi:hypothetical protein
VGRGVVMVVEDWRDELVGRMGGAQQQHAADGAPPLMLGVMLLLVRTYSSFNINGRRPNKHLP